MACHSSRQCGDGALDGCVVGDVELERVDIACAGKRGAFAFQAVLAAGGEQQARALRGEGAGGGQSDAGAGAGDKGNLLCEVL